MVDFNLKLIPIISRSSIFPNFKYYKYYEWKPLFIYDTAVYC